MKLKSLINGIIWVNGFICYAVLNAAVFSEVTVLKMEDNEI